MKILGAFFMALPLVAILTMAVLTVGWLGMIFSVAVVVLFLGSIWLGVYLWERE